MASSCSGIFSRILLFYYDASSPGSPLPRLLDEHRDIVGSSAIPASSCPKPVTSSSCQTESRSNLDSKHKTETKSSFWYVLQNFILSKPFSLKTETETYLYEERKTNEKRKKTKKNLVGARHLLSLVQWLGWVFENKERKKERFFLVPNPKRKLAQARWHKHLVLVQTTPNSANFTVQVIGD